jgi:hemerythrin superfamily protein
MNAIDLLKSQHRKVASLFTGIERARTADKKDELFTELADSLAIHSSIEEHHFYPAVRERSTEAIVFEFMKEHLGIKRLLSALLDVDADEPSFAARLKTLKTEVERHVAEEENELFPRVAKILDVDELEQLGQVMSAEQAELERKGSPRDAVPAEVEAAEIL